MLDSTDLAIIELLKKNARYPYKKIAEKLGLSESAVRKRVKKLVEKGVIKKFTIEVDTEKMGKSITAFIKVNHAGFKADKVIKSLVKIPEVEEAFYMSGKCGILLRVSVDSIKALDQLVEGIMQIPGVLSVENYVVLRKLK